MSLVFSIGETSVSPSSMCQGKSTAFQAVRRRLDPKGRFRTPYLERVLAR